MRIPAVGYYLKFKKYVEENINVYVNYCLYIIFNNIFNLNI